jgi:hypothetical protein
VHFQPVTFIIEFRKGFLQMARRNITPSWLQSLTSLLTRRRQRRLPRMTRRLRGERLENRTVLSVAPVPVEETEGESLAEYIAQERQMGPSAPAELAAPAEQDSQDLPEALAPASIDQLFGIEQGEEQGAGLGEGEGSGSGSGSGSGTGSGSGSGSGSPPDEDPVISDTDVRTDEGIVTVTGQLEDDGELDDLTLTLDNGSGTVTINSDGTFSVEITDPNGYSTFTITVTDGNGNVTAYSFDYPL